MAGGAVKTNICMNDNVFVSIIIAMRDALRSIFLYNYALLKLLYVKSHFC